MYYEKKYKKISKERYKSLTKGMSDWEIQLQDRVVKQLKRDKYFNNGEGIGILEYIRQQENLPKVEYTEDDYEYMIADGYQLVIVGSAKTLEAFENAFKDLCRLNN